MVVANEIRRRIIELLETAECDRKFAASLFNIPYRTICRIYDYYLKKWQERFITNRWQKTEKAK
jgi:hypothetical protein